MGPADGASSGRQVAARGRGIALLVEEALHRVHLLAELVQHVVVLECELGGDGLAGLDVLEVLQHVKSTLSRAQRPERGVDEEARLTLDPPHLREK